jgi:Ca2+-binding RTX toxin-like protein
VIDVFGLGSFKRIVVYGFAGNDKLVVSEQVQVRTVLDGGMGDDSLVAGSGPTLALGGAGNDVLIGSDQRDILIGGDGADTLYGNGDDDILIGGRTFFDDQIPQLLAIQDTWNSGDPYKVRVEALWNGAIGLLATGRAFVTFDGNVDNLVGGMGTDWYFAGPDTKIRDLNPEEKLT